jgi:DNA-binding NtrC family response regulator
MEPRTYARPRLADFASPSPAMVTFLNLVRRVVDSPTTLVVQGETGVGKEHLARAIHAEGSRSDSPFVAIDCGAIPADLMESELFGHERGAFTGAERRRRGLFEIAGAGTLLLDEIGEMPLSLQVKLLGVLERRVIQRIGGEAEIPVKARIIAATNRDLKKEVAAGKFREDLYYRLAVFPLLIPPLRQRTEEIPFLAERVVRWARDRLGRPQVTGISPAAMERLLRYRWPGNVRELQNVLERAVLLTRSTRILPRDLPPEMRREAERAAEDEPATAGLFRKSTLALSLAEARRDVMDRFELEYLRRELTRTAGSVGLTAAAAGITPRSLYDKMKAHGLRKEDFRRARI